MEQYPDQPVVPHESIMAVKQEIANHKDIADYLYDQYRVAYEHGIIEKLFNFTDNIAAIEGEHFSAPHGSGVAFHRGMLFALAVAEQWLDYEELEMLDEAIIGTTKKFHDQLDRITSNPNDEELWAKVLLDEGAAGLHQADGLPAVLEDYIGSIEIDRDLHPLVRAGAGWMTLTLTEAISIYEPTKELEQTISDIKKGDVNFEGDLADLIEEENKR